MRKSSFIRGRQARHAALAGVLLFVLLAGAEAAWSATPPVAPYGQTGTYLLVKDWSFGAGRADATVKNRGDLDREFFYRYIHAGGKLDGLPSYWSYHRDYPDGDPRSLHVFGDTTLTLKGRIPPKGGLWPRGIETGILRAKLPITPGMYIEMRARLPYGIGAWPAFWLSPGVQYADGTFSDLPWPPEIDIFEFFNWQGRSRTKVMTANVQTSGKPERYGTPHDLFSKFDKKGEYAPGTDFSADFHVFALDWVENKPIWLVDGVPVKQTYYEWPGPPAHLLITNQLGMTFPNANLTAMQPDENQWDYVIDYIRIWQHKAAPEQPEKLKVQ